MRDRRPAWRIAGVSLVCFVLATTLPGCSDEPPRTTPDPVVFAVTSAMPQLTTGGHWVDPPLWPGTALHLVAGPLSMEFYTALGWILGTPLDPRFDQRIALDGTVLANDPSSATFDPSHVPLLHAVQDARGPAVHRAFEVWSIGFDLDANRACTAATDLAVPSGDGSARVRAIQQRGLHDPAAHAHLAADTLTWLDRKLPYGLMRAGKCAASDSFYSDAANPWCWPNFFDIDFGREPFGLGGWQVSEIPQWLDAFQQFILAMRQAFPRQGEDVVFSAPGTLELAEDATLSAAMRAFVPYVAQHQLPISSLSVVIQASTPDGVARVVDSVAALAAEQGVQSDYYLNRVVNVLDVVVPSTVWPASLPQTYEARATYLGAFYLATGILIFDKVTRWATGRLAPLTAACGNPGDPDRTWPADMAVFGRPGVPDGTPSAAAWWLTPADRTWSVGHPVLLARTASQGVYVLVTATDCPQESYLMLDHSTVTAPSCIGPAYYADLDQRDPAHRLPTATFSGAIRVLISDMRTPSADLPELEVKVPLPDDVTQVFIRRAAADGTLATGVFRFDDTGWQPVTGHQLDLRFGGRAPAMFFAEAYF